MRALVRYFVIKTEGLWMKGSCSVRLPKQVTPQMETWITDAI